MSSGAQHYDPGVIAFLEELWGDGYLSPGGPEEVARILGGIDLAGRTVLDIGSGSGGITVDLVRRHGAGRVVGIDVEADVCNAARERVAAAGLADRIEIRQVAPGPLDFPDGSFDVVFSKDSIVHVPDKEALARDAFRILRPGGWFAASDWLTDHDGEPSDEMRYYLKCEDLDFAMASPARYRRALEAAGFTDIRLVDRNPWYREHARAELARMSGPDRPAFERILGAEAVDAQIRTWQAMIPVIDSGEHCPHHFRGRKP